MLKKYFIVIEKAANNYSAYSPEIPGCITTGDTLEETIENMKEALEFHFEALDYIPEAKGLKYYMDNGLFKEEDVNDDCFIAHVEVPLPFETELVSRL